MNALLVFLVHENRARAIAGLPRLEVDTAERCRAVHDIAHGRLVAARATGKIESGTDPASVQRHMSAVLDDLASLVPVTLVESNG